MWLCDLANFITLAYAAAIFTEEMTHDDTSPRFRAAAKPECRNECDDKNRDGDFFSYRIGSPISSLFLKRNFWSFEILVEVVK